MLAWQIACRYLFSKKSHSAINVITVVAACGIAVITTALICTLSVYNGFESLVQSLCSNFDPDLRIESAEGKSFAASDELRKQIAAQEGVQVVGETLEETVLLSYNNRQVPAVMKGVDSLFSEITSVDSIMRSGYFVLSDPVAQYGVLGVGVASALGVNAGFIRPFTVYCPRRKGKIDLMRPENAFTEGYLFCNGVFLVDQREYDDRIFLSSIDFARTLLGDSLLTTAYEVKLLPEASPQRVKKQLEQSLGSTFRIRTRMEQQADIYKIMQIEKWITFLIIVFILLIASFNVIGALSMLIIDKEPELFALRSLGASETLIRRIFLLEGWLISGSGALFGIVLGVALCWLQQHYGFISMGDGSALYILDAYPVRLMWSDVLWSVLSVLFVGALATIYPLKSIRMKV